MAPDRLESIVERITFVSAENGYSVLRVRPNRLRRGLIGALPELQPGESNRFGGIWASHPRH